MNLVKMKTKDADQQVIVTHELLERGKSDNGGWSNRQLRCLGIETRFKNKGWKWDLIGQRVSQRRVDDFLRLRNQHLKPKNNLFTHRSDRESTKRTRAIFREIGRLSWTALTVAERNKLFEYAGQSRFSIADMQFVSRMRDKIINNTKGRKC